MSKKTLLVASARFLLAWAAAGAFLALSADRGVTQTTTPFKALVYTPKAPPTLTAVADEACRGGRRAIKKGGYLDILLDIGTGRSDGVKANSIHTDQDRFSRELFVIADDCMGDKLRPSGRAIVIQRQTVDQNHLLSRYFLITSDGALIRAVYAETPPKGEGVKYQSLEITQAVQKIFNEEKSYWLRHYDSGQIYRFYEK